MHLGLLVALHVIGVSANSMMGYHSWEMAIPIARTTQKEGVFFTRQEQNVQDLAQKILMSF